LGKTDHRHWAEPGSLAAWQARNPGRTKMDHGPKFTMEGEAVRFWEEQWGRGDCSKYSIFMPQIQLVDDYS